MDYSPTPILIRTSRDLRSLGTANVLVCESPQGFGAWRGSYDREDVAWYESPSGFVEWDAGLSYKCGNSAYMCSLREWRSRASGDEDIAPQDQRKG
jgi:hypothetical protein